MTEKRKSGFSIAVTALLLCLAFSVCACGKKSADTETVEEQDLIGATTINTLRIAEDGKITEIAVEDYTGSTYKLPEIRQFIREEVDAYNQKKGVDKVSFLQIRDDNGVVKTAISYSDIGAYNDFNQMNVQLAVYSPEAANKVEAEDQEKHKTDATEQKRELSEAELAEAGYDPADLEQEEIKSLVEEKAVSATFTDGSGNTVGADSIDAKQKMMVVTDEKLAVETPDGKLLYTNKHASIKENAAVTDGQGTAIVVLFLGY